MNDYFDVLSKYVVFSGRASRREFWMFFLVNLIITLFLIIAQRLIGGPIREIAIFSALYGLAVFLPSMGVTFRRLHDIGYSGWWYLISFVPLIGSLVLLLVCADEGDPCSNKYGPNPYVIPFMLPRAD